MIINILFQFLNFAVLMTLFYYGIQKFLIPSVNKMIEKYDNFIFELKDSRQAVENKCQAITEKINSQEEQFKAVQLKFVVWQEKCRDRKILQITDQHQIVENIQNRFLLRSQVVMNEVAIKEQLPYILEKTAKKLQEKYHVADTQKVYINELIHVMKEQK